MLKLRILSALVLVPLVVWALFAWPRAQFAALLGFFIVIGAWEWSTLIGLRRVVVRIGYVALLTVAGVALILNRSWVPPLLVMASVFWLWAFIELLAYDDTRAGFLASRPGLLLGGFLVLLPAWLVPLWLSDLPHGRWLALYVMVIVWGADTGAYFAGHRFGRHKLAPQVSPGKTWEGVAGGLLVASALAVGTGLYGFRFTPGDQAVWLVLTMVVALVSVLGDLFESRVKRAAGVKDSGVLIPGHGGVLDRIDAFTAAAPVFALAWLVWRQPLVMP